MRKMNVLMKMNSKIIRFCALLVMVYIASGMSVKAAPIYENVDGDLSPDELGGNSVNYQWEGEDEYLETENEQVIYTLDSAQGFSYALSVPHYRQENGYYCGPATTQQTISYLGGGNISQNNLAAELGTTSAGTAMGYIPNVINKHKPGINYVMRKIPNNQSSYASQVYAALSKGRPVIIDITASKTGGWQYDTKGHFLNISGISCNRTGNVVVVTDPNSYNATDTYSLATVYNANSNHFNKAYIW